MTITQPATMITDYVLALASVIFAKSLLRAPGSSRKPALLWNIGFIAAAAAALAGGAYHGFAHYFSEVSHRALWNFTVGLIGTSAGFMISAGLSRDPRPDGADKPWLKMGLSLTLAGLAIQFSGFSIHTNFTNSDLYHCIQTVALYLFFRGAKLGDEERTRQGPRPA